MHRECNGCKYCAEMFSENDWCNLFGMWVEDAYFDLCWGFCKD